MADDDKPRTSVGIDWASAPSTSTTVRWARDKDGKAHLVDENGKRIERNEQEIGRVLRDGESVVVTSFELLDDPHPDRPSRVRAKPWDARRTHWLDRIEALREGDACEVQSNADAKWYQGIVKRNGGAGFWVVEVLGERWFRHIEQVRCVGQTEAWPR